MGVEWQEWWLFEGIVWALEWFIGNMDKMNGL